IERGPPRRGELALPNFRVPCQTFGLGFKGAFMSPNPIRRGLVLAFALGFLAMPFVSTAARAADVTVFAAASLKNALDDAAKLYETKTGDKVVVSYAAS